MKIVAGRFEDRATFLADLTLDPPSSTQDLAADPLLDEDYLILSTIHSAKGLEWDAVYVLHAADGNLPSDMATGSEAEIEEERRLFYVALTRAKNRLFVCYPQRYYFANRRRGDEYGLAQRTRFLPESVLERFQERLAIERDELVQKIIDAASTRVSSAEVRQELKQIFQSRGLPVLVRWPHGSISLEESWRISFRLGPRRFAKPFRRGMLAIRMWERCPIRSLKTC